MGKNLDCFLRRKFRTSKFKTLVNNAISRIAYLEKEHRVRCSQAQSDVLQLLNLGQQERVLLRVEFVIMEQNMLDSYSMIENYFNQLTERVVLIENNTECPDDLKEAVASLIFAATRCGELPELQKIRAVLTSRFGKEFAVRAVELRNNCGVNPKIVKKLSTRRPSLDSKLKVLNEIAPLNEITQNLGGKAFAATEGKKKKVGTDERLLHGANKLVVRESAIGKEQQINIYKDEKFQEIVKVFGQAAWKLEGETNFEDADMAAQVACILATQAAAAARATMKLLRHENDVDHYSTPNNQKYQQMIIQSSGLTSEDENVQKENALQNEKSLSVYQDVGMVKNSLVSGTSLTPSDRLDENHAMAEGSGENKDKTLSKRRRLSSFFHRRSGSITIKSFKSRKSSVAPDTDASDHSKHVPNHMFSFEDMMEPQADSMASSSGKKPTLEGEHKLTDMEISRSSSMGRKPLSSRSRRGNK